MIWAKLADGHLCRRKVSRRKHFVVYYMESSMSGIFTECKFHGAVNSPRSTSVVKYLNTGAVNSPRSTSVVKYLTTGHYY